MNRPVSPFEVEPPGARRLIRSVVLAIVAAGAVLVAIVLPAEYGIDPTGIGGALGLTALNQPARTLEIEDVIGGNETYRQVQLPDPGEPMPLPNPAVSQVKTGAARTDTLKVTLAPGQQTEIKTVLEAAQVVLYSWTAQGGEVYTDFHGHEPGAGEEAWVRYEEQQSGTAGHGSLVAPFAGEHGWFWLNISEQPVTVTLTLHGYYQKYVDYGLF